MPPSVVQSTQPRLDLLQNPWSVPVYSRTWKTRFSKKPKKALLRYAAQRQGTCPPMLYTIHHSVPVQIYRNRTFFGVLPWAGPFVWCAWLRLKRIISLLNLLHLSLYIPSLCMQQHPERRLQRHEEGPAIGGDAFPPTHMPSGLCIISVLPPM